MRHWFKHSMIAVAAVAFGPLAGLFAELIRVFQVILEEVLQHPDRAEAFRFRSLRDLLGATPGPALSCAIDS